MRDYTRELELLAAIKEIQNDLHSDGSLSTAAWLDLTKRCLRYPGLLTRWERSFLRAARAYEYPSLRQLWKCRQIEKQLQERRAWLAPDLPR